MAGYVTVCHVMLVTGATGQRSAFRDTSTNPRVSCEVRSMTIGVGKQAIEFRPLNVKAGQAVLLPSVVIHSVGPVSVITKSMKRMTSRTRPRERPRLPLCLSSRHDAGEYELRCRDPAGGRDRRAGCEAPPPTHARVSRETRPNLDAGYDILHLHFLDHHPLCCLPRWPRPG